ncbi:hypothetical protein L596_022892 [Steinernema carpocapsae]|uniref:Uncharacterized protein n=1 Tax=Steinernema carpocapsae TaxID=34508 RepID=A0A4V5ZZ71_STECR|nr:hypothetical protein L596_022892 [Steinernema carpocapsae]
MTQSEDGSTSTHSRVSSGYSDGYQDSEAESRGVPSTTTDLSLWELSSDCSSVAANEVDQKKECLDDERSKILFLLDEIDYFLDNNQSLLKSSIIESAACENALVALHSKAKKGEQDRRISDKEDKIDQDAQIAPVEDRKSPFSDRSESRQTGGCDKMGSTLELSSSLRESSCCSACSGCESVSARLSRASYLNASIQHTVGVPTMSFTFSGTSLGVSKRPAQQASLKLSITPSKVSPEPSKAVSPGTQTVVELCPTQISMGSDPLLVPQNSLATMYLPDESTYYEASMMPSSPLSTSLYEHIPINETQQVQKGTVKGTVYGKHLKELGFEEETQLTQIPPVVFRFASGSYVDTCYELKALQNDANQLSLKTAIGATSSSDSSSGDTETSTSGSTTDSSSYETSSGSSYETTTESSTSSVSVSGSVSTASLPSTVG